MSFDQQTLSRIMTGLQVFKWRHDRSANSDLLHGTFRSTQTLMFPHSQHPDIIGLLLKENEEVQEATMKLLMQSFRYWIVIEPSIWAVCTEHQSVSKQLIQHYLAFNNSTRWFTVPPYNQILGSLDEPCYFWTFQPTAPHHSQVNLVIMQDAMVERRTWFEQQCQIDHSCGLYRTWEDNIMQYHLNFATFERFATGWKLVVDCMIMYLNLLPAEMAASLFKAYIVQARCNGNQTQLYEFFLHIVLHPLQRNAALVHLIWSWYKDPDIGLIPELTNFLMHDLTTKQLIGLELENRQSSHPDFSHDVVPGNCVAQV